MRSMTGFGAGSAAAGDMTVTVEVRSVNHRFLQVKARLGVELADLESEVEQLVKKRLERGSVNLSVKLESRAASAVVRVDSELVSRYRAALLELSQLAGASGELSLAQWAALPGVFGAAASASDRDALVPAVERAVVQALAGLVAMREAEGAALAADLAKHTAALADVTRKIARRVPTVVRQNQKELQRRVSELLGRTDLEPSDLAREIALIADRADVSEEIARLESHLEQFGKLVAKSKGGVGRQLDFLVQEIFREVNTIGSKSSDAKIAHWVVDAKTHTERLREQVQNAE